MGSTGIKAACRTLMKWTPGVDFINFQHTAFMLVDPDSAKKIQLSHQYPFMLLGSTGAKAAHIMLMKSTPEAERTRTNF